MKRLLTTLVVLAGLIGSADAVWADAESNLKKGAAAYQAGHYAERRSGIASRFNNF